MSHVDEHPAGSMSAEDAGSFRFDPFAERHLSHADKALQNSIRIVEKDTKFRSSLNGPLIQREKYTSNYWRNWNKEKNLLEDISYDEVVKQQSGSVFTASASNLLLTHTKPSQSRSIVVKKTLEPLRKKNNTAKIRSVAFAAPDAYDKIHKRFDPRNLGKTSVEYLMESCLKQKVPTNHAELNATVDPDDIGVRHAKGTAMSTADRSGLAPVNITAKCDYPPLDSAVNPHKGFTWGSNPRFKADVPVPVVEDSTLSTIERPAHPAGIVFERADRFPNKDCRPSVIVKIPVHDGNASVSVLSAEEFGDSTVLGNEHSNMSEARTDNFPHRSTGADQQLNEIKPLPQTMKPNQVTHIKDGEVGSDGESECGFETQKENEIKLPGGSTVGDPKLPTQTSNDGSANEVKLPQKYIEYEYYPDDKPGPGHYHVDRLFDNVKGARGLDFDALIDKYRKIKPGLAGLKCADVSNVAVFGQECNRQEHVLYGMCLDGRCCRRSETEKFMLRRNDVQRLAGYEGIAKHGKSKVKERMCDEMLYSATMRELLPEARYAVEPLYAAAYNGDVDAIRSLSKADTNPNIKHPNSGYTALHVAVFHCKLDAVAALLSYFRGRIALNVQDKKGDTALHLASRLGFVEITSAICNEDSCDPLLVKNNDGMYPIDVVRSHKVWQMIKVCQTRNDLLEELHALKKH